MEQYFGIGPVSQSLPAAAVSSANVYEAFAGLGIDGDNMLHGDLWVTLNGDPLVSGLGTASITIYDDADAVVLTQTGLTANVNGVYLMTPVLATNLTAFELYRIKVQITHNSIFRTSYGVVTIGE